ncbi:Membrane transport protein [Trinorchestia longiramus]|nr:Membrane transport protein [Trinorchestia longiramus]
MLQPISRYLPVCMVMIGGSLLGIVLLGHFSSKYNTHKPAIALKIAVCKGVFHYGFMSLPLPCLELLLADTSARTVVGPPTPALAEEYSIVQYLDINVTFSSSGEELTKNNSQNTVGLEMMAETTAPAQAFLADDSNASVDFSNLYVAVLQCFAIILCGYVAGRSNIISQTEARGLNTFVSYFSLPALIFLSLSRLNFSCVNWLFLCAICLAKTTVFALVAIITLLVHRPTDFSKAGLYAIFCTQSNDFALGYPIVEALYGVSHPDFPSYLYLLAPISLVFLNPLGFILMEVGKNIQATRSSTRQQTLHSSSSADGDNVNSTSDNASMTSASSDRPDNPVVPPESRRKPSVLKKFQFLTKTLKGIVLNPVVTMSILGILFNTLFGGRMPQLFENILEVLGQAFSASALFALGVRMVGQVASLRGSSLVVPGILITVKTLMLPLVCREFVSLLKPGGDAANTTKDYSNYGFLYGTFPTAPSVFVFASHYNVQPDLMASSMVAVTFLSAPLMLVSAKMVSLVHINPLYYVVELENFLFQVSIVGIIASLWVLVVFLLNRKWRQVPHFITLCLAASQCIAALGALLWSVLDCEHMWQLYLQFTLVTFGVFASRFFTALLAASLFLLRWRSLSTVLSLRPVMMVIGWGIPGILVLVLVMAVQREIDVVDKQDLNFQYGTTQAVIALLLLWFTLFTTIVCLILQQRQQRRYEPYSSLSDAQSPDDVAPLNLARNGDDIAARPVLFDGSDMDVTSSDSDTLFSPNEELRPASRTSKNHRFSCPKSTAGSSPPLIKPVSFALSDAVHETEARGEQRNCDIDDLNKVSNRNNLDPQCSEAASRVSIGAGNEDHSMNASQSSQQAYSDGTKLRSRNIFDASNNESSYRQHQPSVTRLTIPQESTILRDRDDEFQMMRHVVLLLFLCSSMIVGFGLCLWTLVSDDVSGVYVEMVFLDAVLNYGQGLITAAIFGLDPNLIVLPLSRWYRRLRYGASAIRLPPLNDVPVAHLQVCEQFRRYHMDQCCRDIVRNRRWRLQKLQGVFAGQELVDWLLMVGLANDRTHAVR